MTHVVRKLVRLLLVVFAVTALTFLMVNLLPGDIAYLIAGQGATLEDVASIRSNLGLDENLAIRYLKWISEVLKGDLGKSYFNRQPVLQAILTRLPVTAELIIFSQFFALLLAVPLGILCAQKPGRFLDNTLSAIAFGLMSVPVFASGLVLIYLFSIKLAWLPATGYVPLSLSPLSNIKSMLLPSISLALIEWVPLMRVLRSDMITTLQEDFILMARAKGLPLSHILFRHALRPSSLTLVTLIGIQIGHLIGGAIIVELLFALPGIGRLMVTAIYGRDYMVVQGCVLFITLSFVSINFLVDILYTTLDPRIRKAVTENI